MSAVEQIRTSCRGCHGVCQVIVHRDASGRILKVTGDPDSPTSQGYICPKGMAAPEFLYHPDRITRPLRRKGPRGGGQWEAISWEEALDEIVTKFDRIRKESGPEYVALCQGTGRPYTEFTARFIHAFGSPNFVSPGHNCFLPRNIGAAITLGWFPVADIYGRGGTMPGTIFVMGSNIMQTGAADGTCGSMVKKAFKQAKSVIVADPRRTPSAAAAHHHLQLRPGSECALVLALLHVIIHEELYDKAFVEKHCSGFPELSAHVKEFSPEWAAPITRVSAEQLRVAARAMAANPPFAMIWGNGIDCSVNAFQTGRALLLLSAILGSLDVPGGMVQWVPPAGVRNKSPMLSREVTGGQFLSPELNAKMIGAGKFPFCPGCHQPSFWEACVSGDPYRPRAVWLVGTNPMMTATRGDLIEKALREHLEFTVVSDFVLTPAAELADLVLPAAHWLEQDDVVFFHKVWCILARRKLAQVGEARDDRDVLLDVARRLGLHEAFPWASRQEYLEWLLEPAGLSFAEFAEKEILFGEMRYRKYEQDGFHTPSGKVELYSSIMEHAERQPLPVFVEPPISPISRPDLAKDYPFIFMSGCKILPFFHSEGRHVASQRRLHDKPCVDIHPDTAAALGLAKGDAAKVSTPHGSASFIVNLDQSLDKDVIHAEHAWWFPEQPGPGHGWQGSNVNLLFSHEHFDPDSGAEPLKCGLCRLEKEI